MSIAGERLVRFAQTTSRAAVGCAVLGALGALAGWCFDWPLARTILPGAVAMNPTTAVLFLASGAALGLLRDERRLRRRTGQAAGAAVAGLGVLKLGDYLLGWGLHFDQILFRAALNGNQIAPNTALCFLLTGLALALLDVQTRRGVRPAQLLALAAGLVSFLSLVGYAYGARSLYGVASYIPMAANTAVLFHALAIGILAARPQSGVMAVFADGGVGGMAVRRLSLAALAIPFFLGWLRLLGERAGWYGAAFGVALMVVGSVVALTALIWWTGAALVRIDAHRRQAEQALRRLNQRLEQRVADRTAELAQANQALHAEVQEHRRARRKLAAANRDLEQKSQENEMFVYSVSHDLRSPLVNLQGFSRELDEVCRELRGVIADHPLPRTVQQKALALIDEDAAESLHFIQSAVRRLSGIIDALLRLSRAGRVEYQSQSVDLSAVAVGVVDSMSATIAQREATVRVGTLPRVEGDPTAVEQVLANLIGNALNYLDPQRPGEVEVGWRAGAGVSGQHVVYVQDNGLGIPPQQQVKAFQAFQRLHPHAAPGEGMGLAIAHRIVQRHGGRIWIESRDGPGTTFCVALPAAEEESACCDRGANGAVSPEESIHEHARAALDPCVSGR